MGLADEVKKIASDAELSKNKLAELKRQIDIYGMDGNITKLGDFSRALVNIAEKVSDLEKKNGELVSQLAVAQKATDEKDRTIKDLQSKMSSMQK